MAKKILAVYDPCQGYLERFLGYASRRNCAGGLEICGYTDPDILEAALRDGRISAVLFSQNKINVGGIERISTLLTKENHNKDLTVMMLGEQPADKSEIKGSVFINKYRKAEEIFKDICEVMGVNTENDGTCRERDLHLSGIYSPWDKSCHPELAVQIANIIKRERRECGKILYMELEQFSGMKTYLGLPGDAGLSNVIYYYKTRPEQLGRALEQAAGSFRGLDILTAPGNPEDLGEIEGEEWPDFLESISRAGEYQNIILDISVMDRFLCELICKHGNLYIPALPRLQNAVKPGSRYTLAEYKLKEYREYLKKSGNEGIMEKIYEISLNAGISSF